MKHLGKVLEQTSWSSARNTLNNNSNTLYEAITQLENVTIKNAGYFLSEDALKKTVPNPTMGMIAYVRDLNSGVYYIWNTYLKDNVPTWTGTTTTVPEPNISADTIDSLNKSVSDVVDTHEELTNRVNTNSNNIEKLQNTVNTHNTKFSSLDSDIEELNQDKQDKLAHYTEEDENATIATRETISLHTEQQVGTASISLDATTSEVEMASTNHNSEHARVLLNNGNISIDADVKVSMSCDSGETVIEDVVGTIKEIVDYMAKEETDDDQINDTLNQHEERLEELANSVQMLQDDTEDLQSMRDTIDSLGTDKADKSALEATNKTVEGKQDKLQTYTETTNKVQIELPNGTSRIEVSKELAAMYAQGDKSGIINSSNGSRLVYKETATDAKGESYTSHRDDISIGKHDGDSATHITLTSKSTTEEAGEKLTSTSTIQVNPERISMSSPNGEIGDVVKEINEKAPKVGYAPDLKVNFAKELVGRGESTPEVIGGIRPTGVRSIGDGNATITKVRGNSVVWNQLEPNHNLLANALSSACNNVTTVNGVVSIGGVTSYSAYIYVSRQNINIRKGHVYLLIVDARGAEKITNQMAVYDLDNRKSLISTLNYGEVTNQWATYAKIGVAQEDGVGSLLVYPAYSVILYNTLTDWQGRNFIIHDLTLMFGSGNEPTTIEDFEARKPLGVTNEYNEGTIVSFDGSALKSVGFNAFNGTYAKVIGGEEYHATGTTSISFAKELDGDTTPITLDSNGKFTPTEDGYVYAEGKDIVIHLTHSYTPEHVDEYEEDVHPLPDVKSILDAEGNQLFPYGLLSAGSVHDEITATKAIKMVGVVDMGTLNWGRLAEADIYAFQVTLTDIGVYSNTTSVPNLLNKAYPSVIRADIKARDKCISQNNGGKALVIRDDAYTDIDSFKQAMQGVLLYYELAEPIEVDLPEPLNMTYEAWDFGTEELVAKGVTTPLNADIVYQFNAVDRIRENSSAIDDLEEHVEERKDDGIKLLDNGNLKLTLKGETREFMPATPSGDPMHYAYVSAGAEYNDSGADKVKDAPWAALADTDEEKKVIHKAGCWYLNGVGDMTNDDIRYSYTNRTLLYDLNKRATRSNNNIIRTIYPAYVGSSVSGFGPTKASSFFGCSRLETFLLSDMPILRKEPDFSLSLSGSYEFKGCKALKAMGQLTLTNIDNNRFAGCTSLRYIWIYALKVFINLKDSSLISKLSVKYMIENAAPTSAISITLHADAYARLAEDADIVAALEAKPLVTLVSA